MTHEHSVGRRVAAGTATKVAGQAVVVLSLIALAPITVHVVGAEYVADFERVSRDRERP